MYADPQSVTIGGTTTSLPKTVANPTSSIFGAPSSLVNLDISHQTSTNQTRSLSRLRQNKVSTNPITDVKKKSTLASQFIIIRESGWTDAETLAHAKGHIAHLGASTDAALIKLIAGEP